jgi:hypothetical protein
MAVIRPTFGMPGWQNHLRRLRNTISQDHPKPTFKLQILSFHHVSFRGRESKKLRSSKMMQFELKEVGYLPNKSTCRVCDIQAVQTDADAGYFY